MQRQRFAQPHFFDGDIVKVDGKAGEFRIEFLLGDVAWVYALGERPRGFIRDTWEPAFRLRPLTVPRAVHPMEIA